MDIYDLILFSIVRVPSLKSLGLSGEPLFHQGVLLLNMQMIGMLVGGIFWGILGDKRGRLSVLFGSILLYSVANFANGFVHSIESYAVLRFVAGVGLAGELGAGITLVAELLPKEKRGIGTTIVASVGICGALLAGYIAEKFDWRVAYIIGGVLGIALLLLRVSVFESGMFEQCKAKVARRGDFFALFSSWPRLRKYLCCILIGVPLWYVVGILITFSPEFAPHLGVTEPITAGRAIMFNYFGLAVGDLLSGLVSQWLKSRKKVVAVFLLFTVGMVLVFASLRGLSAWEFYGVCALLGLGVGYWAMFVTIAAEQFGTNLRATVATTVPNFVRGAVVPLSLLFTGLTPHLGILGSALSVGAGSFALAFLALGQLEESFHKDLDYVETLTPS